MTVSPTARQQLDDEAGAAAAATDPAAAEGGGGAPVQEMVAGERLRYDIRYTLFPPSEETPHNLR